MSETDIPASYELLRMVTRRGRVHRAAQELDTPQLVGLVDLCTDRCDAERQLIVETTAHMQAYADTSQQYDIHASTLRRSRKDLHRHARIRTGLLHIIEQRNEALVADTGY